MRCYILILGLIWLLPGMVRAQDSNTNPVFAARADKAFHSAQAKYLANTNDSTTGWQFASTCFDLTFFSTNDTQRAEVAQLGIDACREIVAHDPKSAPGHYYLAMNLGELAQALAPSITAYHLVHEVEHEFKVAAELDPKIDYAGPARNLGELYYQAPSWPLSIGSHRKAREWLEKAVALAPEYPENQLNLLEARLKWRQAKEAEASVKSMESIWPAARRNFTGESRAKDWVDWSAERSLLLKEFNRLYPPDSNP